MKFLRLKLSGLFSQGADAGALFTLAAKLSQSIVSLLVLLAIGSYFTLELQGYYYTFLSLTAMQTFVELGLYIVVSVLASHEWSSLKLDSHGFVVGDAVARSRLSSLLRFVFAWYAIAALVFVFAAGLGGCYFLQSVGKLPLKDWIWPWVWHVGFSAALLWGMPVLAFLEGCNQVRDVAKFKLSQTILSACAFLVAVFWGADLWALPAMSGCTLLLLTHYFFRTKGQFFASILNQAITEKVNWKLEVFPMQWRLAVSGIASYFLMSSFVPVMFYYHGPAVAGQMGMSLQILQAIQSIALIWLSVQGPKLAMLVASGQHSAMNSVWADATILSCLAMVFGGGALVVSVYALHYFDIGFADRVLAPALLLVLMVGMIFSVFIHCVAVNLRSYKQELLMPVSVVCGLLTGLGVWWFGERYAAAGAIYSYAAVAGFVAFPWVIHIGMQSASWRHMERVAKR